MTLILLESEVNQRSKSLMSSSSIRSWDTKIVIDMSVWRCLNLDLISEVGDMLCFVSSCPDEPDCYADGYDHQDDRGNWPKRPSRDPAMVRFRLLAYEWHCEQVCMSVGEISGGDVSNSWAIMYGFYFRVAMAAWDDFGSEQYKYKKTSIGCAGDSQEDYLQQYRLLLMIC